MPKRTSLLMALGAALAFITVYRRRRVVESARSWRRRENSRRGTALITGASSGIGETFARRLAQQGYHLAVLARREERLRSLANELAGAYGTRVEIITADLARPEEVERAAQRIAGIPDLSLLINNAGFGTGGSFGEIPPEPELRMIQVHMSAAVRLVRAALPGMIARGHGGIINVSSMASLMPMPGNATYGATKNYLNFFTRSLNAELAGSGVRVQALCPGFTYSEFHDVAGVSRSLIPAFLWMQAEDVVRESLEGLREGREMVIPGAIYKVMALALRLPLMNVVARQAQRFRLVRQWKGAAEG